MKQVSLQTRSIPYVLIAILLLMQAFAVWHDAEHAFHDHVAQCERYEAITHLPVVDATPTLQLDFTQSVLQREMQVASVLLSSIPVLIPPIRGPPADLINV